MNKFYNSTKYLWVISRILLILLFSSSILSRITEPGISDILVNSLFLVLIILMILITIFGILKKEPHYFLRFIVGTFTILFGFLISYLLWTYGNIDRAIHTKIGMQLLPLWIILYGIFEIVNGIDALKRNGIKKN